MEGVDYNPRWEGIPRVALLVSHPTQVEVPFYQLLTRNHALALTVYYWSTVKLPEMVDAELGHPPGWDFELTQGYEWALLPSPARRQWSFIRHNIFQPGKYQAVIISGWSARAARLALCAGLLSRSRFSLSTDTTRVYPRTLWRTLARGIVLGAVFPLVPAFLAKGSLAREHLLQFRVSPNKIFLFPYAVDNAAFKQQSDLYRQRKAQLRAELNLPPEAIVVLSVAKCVPREGVMDTLRAYDRVSRGEQPVAWVLVGDGPQQPALVEFVNSHRTPRVVFVGYQPYSHLAKYYAMADVFVHAAVQEPWGVSVNEAMACGLPVILSDGVGAAYDLLQEGENGFLFPRGNAAALENKLRLFLSLPLAERAQMGDRSAALIRNWGYEKTLAELQRMLGFLGAGPSPDPSGPRERDGQERRTRC